MAFTINGTSAELAGVKVARVEVGTGMADSATLETTADWATSPYAYGDWLGIASDGTVLIYGMVTGVEPYAIGGGKQGHRIHVSGPWWHLERTPYTQPFYYALDATTQEAKPRSKCWVGMDPSTGERCDTNAALTHILGAAIAAGVPFTYSLSFTGQNAPPFEVTDATCGSVAKQLMRWHPGCFFFWRYTAGAAVLHVKASEGTASFACTDSGGAIVPLNVRPIYRSDLAPTGIIIRWERVNTFEMTGDTSDVVQRIEQFTESAGSSTPAPGVLMYTIEVKGSETQYAEQAIVTRTIPDDVAPGDDPTGSVRAKVLKWYKNHIPALKGLPDELLRIGEHTSTMDLPVWDDDDSQHPTEWPEDDDLREYDESVEVSDLPRELVEGQIPEWAPWIKAEPMVARLVVSWSDPDGDATEEEAELAKVLFGEDLDPSSSQTYDIQFTGTNARTKRYKGLVKYVEPEPWPTAGLAASVYASLTGKVYEGEVTATGNAMPVGIKPGNALTLTDGSTATGIVQRVIWDAAAKRTTVSFGPPSHLSVPDFIELMRANRLNGFTANYAKDRQQKGTPTSKGSIAGNVRQPRNNVQPVGSSMEAPDHPFKCRVKMDGVDRLLTVTPGTLQGDVPLMDGEPLDSDPAPVLTVGLGTRYVFLEVTVLLNFDSGYMVSHDPPTAVVMINDSVPDDDASVGKWHVLIATITEGIVTAQHVRYSLWCSICDAGGSEGEIRVWTAG